MEMFAGAAALEDGSEDDEQAPISDESLLAEKAYQVCTLALQSAGAVQDDVDANTLRFLERRNIVRILEGGAVVLAREAIQHGMNLSGAVLERTTRETRTTLELLSDLKTQGWKFVKKHKHASLAGKRAIELAPKTYYQLVMHFRDSLLPYEEDGVFHHKQGEQYYRVVECALTARPDEIVEIPTYKPAKFYRRLAAFIVGDSDTDPRAEDKDRKKRTGGVPTEVVGGSMIHVVESFGSSLEFSVQCRVLC